jgi:hypothetical protein
MKTRDPGGLSLVFGDFISELAAFDFWAFGIWQAKS